MNFLWRFMKLSLCILALGPGSTLAEENPTTDFVSDHPLISLYFENSADCDIACKNVITDANAVCDQNGQDSLNCKQVREQQIYSYCLAYNQAGWSAFFDSYLIMLDTMAAYECTRACIATDVIQLAAYEPICNQIAILDGVANAAHQIALHKLLGEYWAGTSAGEQAALAMDLAGVGGL
jgi:hypothetical protein